MIRPVIWSIVLCSVMSLWPAMACSQSARNGKRTFAAIFLYRGTVAGKNTGNSGVYIRTGDTTWTQATLSSVFSFGLGYYERGATRRYYLAAGNGAHRSTDGGRTWRILTSWTTEEILGVLPDPVDSLVVYVATPFGVFKTTDDGVTWEKKMNGFKRWFIQKIIMDREDRNVLYAASEDDLYRSTDAGERWTPLHVGGSEILSILQSPAQPDLLLAGEEDEGIKYSTDRGRSWSFARIPFRTSIYAFGASADGNDLYAAGWQSGLWRSEDGGATWAQIWAADGIEAIYSILVDPDDASHMMAGTVGSGVYESFDRGRTWHRAGLSGAQVKQIEFYP